MQVDDVIDLIEAELEGSAEGEPNMLKNVPNQNPEEEIDSVEDDITGDSTDLDEEPDDEDDYPDQYDENGIASEMVDRTVLEQDSAYQTYFRGVMLKHGIKGIRGLSKDKRSEFFKDVSAGWRKHKKVKEAFDMAEMNRDEYTRKHHKFPPIDRAEKSSKRPPVSSTNVDGRVIRPGHKAVAGPGGKVGEIDSKTGRSYYGEQNLYKEYKKYFTFMMEECGIEDFNSLTEIEQAEFYGLVNEAFQTMNELMQKPGAPIENPMSAHANMLDTMKNQLRPERKARQIAAVKAMRPVRK